MPNKITKITTPDNTEYDIVDDKAYHVNDTTDTTINDTDFVPLSTSSSTKKKSTFSNLVEKIKTKIGRLSAQSGGTDLTLVNTGDMYTWNNKAETSDITTAIQALDGSVTGTPGKGKTLTTFSETNGKVTAKFENISITKSQVSDMPTKLSQFTNDSGFATEAYVTTAIDELPEPMVFKGSLGTGGTITDLPMNGSATIGDTYKVITESDYGSGTYHGKVGDTFICDSQNTTAHTNTWTLIPSGDEPSGTVTSVTIKATSPIVVNSSSAITTSGTRTLSHAASGATAGSYGDSGNQTPNYGGTFKVPYITVNDTGHITEINSHTVKIPASDNTDRYVNSASFTDDTTDNSSNPVKMTLTRAGSDTTKVIANIPKVSSTTAGVVPKGAAVSSQSQSTKFLRSDGTWQTPSYTTNTDTKVTQTLVSTNKNYPLLFSTRETSDTTADRIGTAQRNNAVFVNPSTGKLTNGGNIETIKRVNSSTQANPSELLLTSVYNDGSDKSSSAYFRAYTAKVTSGVNLVIGSGGNTFIGSGEAADNHYNVNTGTQDAPVYPYRYSTTEKMFITSDNDLHLQSTGQDIANRKGILITSNHSILPDVADVATNNAGSIGTSTYKWANVYATKLNGVDIGDNPKFTDTNTKVTQTNDTSNDKAYRVLFSNSNDNTTKADTARKNPYLLYNPSNNFLQVGDDSHYGYVTSTYFTARNGLQAGTYLSIGDASSNIVVFEKDSEVSGSVTVTSPTVSGKLAITDDTKLKKIGTFSDTTGHKLVTKLQATEIQFVVKMPIAITENAADINMVLTIPTESVTRSDGGNKNPGNYQSLRQGYYYAPTAFGTVCIVVWLRTKDNYVYCKLSEVYQNSTTNQATSASYDVYYR